MDDALARALARWTRDFGRGPSSGGPTRWTGYASLLGALRGATARTYPHGPFEGTRNRTTPAGRAHRDRSHSRGGGCQYPSEEVRNLPNKIPQGETLDFCHVSRMHKSFCVCVPLLLMPLIGLIPWFLFLFAIDTNGID